MDTGTDGGKPTDYETGRDPDRQVDTEKGQTGRVLGSRTHTHTPASGLMPRTPTHTSHLALVPTSICSRPHEGGGLLVHTHARTRTQTHTHTHTHTHTQPQKPPQQHHSPPYITLPPPLMYMRIP